MKEGKNPYWTRFSDVSEAELRQTIIEFEPDVVVLERLEVAPYLSVVQDSTNARVILDLDELAGSTNKSLRASDTHDSSGSIRRLWTKYVREFERETVSAVDAVWVSAPDELENFQAEYGSTKPVSLIPNSIDVHAYAGLSEPRIPRHLIFTGNFSYGPNLQAVRFLVDQLMPQLPNYTLELVGTSMPKWLREMDNEQIQVVGAVRDVARHLSRASVAVVPIYSGGGSRLKVLEAMASGTPVVGTSFGVGGHGFIDGRHLLIAESVEDFLSAIQRIERDEPLRQQLTCSALAHIHECRSVESLTKLLRLEYKVSVVD